MLHSECKGPNSDKDEHDRQQNFQIKYFFTLSVRSFLLYYTKL